LKKLKAQQIVEFMLAAPVLIMFFAVLTEFAFAFNANLVFTNAVKSSVSSYISTITADADKNDYQTAVRNYILNDMRKNKVPNLNSLETKLIKVGDYTAVVGSYTYKPGFTFSFLPALKQIKMNTVSIFPFSEIDLSGYENGISTSELNNIQPITETTPEGAAE